jgi:hypothetical protein
MGEHAAEFFGLMSLGPPRVWSAQARQIADAATTTPSLLDSDGTSTSSD